MYMKDYHLEPCVTNPITEINTDPLKNRYSDDEWDAYVEEAKERAKAFPNDEDAYPAEYLAHLIKTYADGEAAETKLQNMGILDSVKDILAAAREALCYDKTEVRAARKATMEKREGEQAKAAWHEHINTADDDIVANDEPVTF